MVSIKLDLVQRLAVVNGDYLLLYFVYFLLELSLYLTFLCVLGHHFVNFGLHLVLGYLIHLDFSLESACLLDSDRL